MNSPSQNTPPQPIQWGWSINAFFYDLAESGLSRRIDSYLLGILAGEGVFEEEERFTAIDYGAGTGALSLKLAKAFKSNGNRNARIYSVENNPWMIQRQRRKIGSLETRLGPESHGKLITPIEQDLYGNIGNTIAGQNNGIDLAIFKRCLYGKREEIEDALKRTYDNLNSKGSIFIVHPEANFQKYCDNGAGGFAPLHALRWGWAELGKLVCEVQYKRRSRIELTSICEAACPDAKIRQHFPQRPAYNVIQIKK